MYEPKPDDEITGLVGYLDQQLAALRAAAYGLTEEQARSTPCRSTLSIAGLLKHTVHGMRGALERPASPDTAPARDADAYAAYQAGFTLTDGESTTGVLAEFDAVRPEFLAAVAATSPGARAVEPPAPWHGITEERPASARYLLVHLVEELARHAGHADIIREQIDGMAVPALVLTLEGAPAGAFFQPYQPAPGTIGA